MRPPGRPALAGASRREGAAWAGRDPEERRFLVASTPDAYQPTPHVLAGSLPSRLQHADDGREQREDALGPGRPRRLRR